MKVQHLDLLCDISELNALFAGSENVESFLYQSANMVATHIHSDVCSIYLYNEAEKTLVLKATKGLNPDCINHTVLQLGEGIVGYAVQKKELICEIIAKENSHYKLINGINEESYQAFIVLPILLGKEITGALVAQRKTGHPFTEKDILTLKAVTSQLAGAIENARILVGLHDKDKIRENKKETVDDISSKKYHFFRGEVASEGMVLGNAIVFNNENPYHLIENIEEEDVYSLEQVQQAFSLTEQQLEKLQTRLEQKITGVASLIFEAHILMLKDSLFTGEMEKKIRDGIRPIKSIISVADCYIRKFSKSSNPYMRDKVNDIEDLTRRILSNLLSSQYEKVSSPNWRGKIIIATELYPSDILRLASEEIGGIILITGGVTSHLAILARSFQIPMVISEHSELLCTTSSTQILLNAEVGNVYVNPTPEIIENYHITEVERKKAQAEVRYIRPSTYTKDGTRIHLLANINVLLDLHLAHDLKLEGVGLYRTEFPFMIRRGFPTEEEQLIIYSSVIEQMEGKPVNIRTLDIGGDKVLSYYDQAKENNPDMGIRSIRFSLGHKDIFHQQIRAILRAGAYCKELRISFPMISSVDELLEAKESIATCAEQLKKKKMTYNANPKIGIMIEVPSTVEIADHLAKEVDFFCVGTNDFIQFMLAVDRSNAMVSSYYLPHHPSVLRALEKIAKATITHNVDISICGEMAHKAQYIPFFLGIGVRTLSIAPHYAPEVQRAVSSWSIPDAEGAAKRLLHQTTIQEVNHALKYCACSLDPIG